MAWYSDEQYEMIKDSREKKHAAASAFKQRTHCGKSGGVKFPSDFMTKKELKAMNGECVSYRMGDPITWGVFKTWPEEHQKTYIIHVKDKYNVPSAVLAKAMGANEVTLNQYIKCLNIGQDKETRPIDIEGFWAWWNGGDDSKTDEQPDLRSPMTWTQFKAMSTENKVSYIEWIRYYFNAPDKYIAIILFKVNPITLHKQILELNLCKGKDSSNSKRKWERESFQAWCDKLKKKVDICPENVVENASVEPVEPVEYEINNVEDMIWPKDDEPVEPCELADDCECKRIYDAGPIAFSGNPIPVIPKNGSMTFENNHVDDILTTLKSLLNGVRVNMTISWEAITENEGRCENA